MDWENHLEKKSDPKNRKTVKIKVKLPHVNKKPQAINRTFVHTPFYHSTLKLEQKIFKPQNHSLFRSTYCFGVTKITTPIWLQKSWNCVNRSLKNIARQVLTYNSMNFHWLNRKLDLERTMNGLEKPFRKQSNPKNWKKSKKSKWNCRMWTKNH